VRCMYINCSCTFKPKPTSVVFCNKQSFCRHVRTLLWVFFSASDLLKLFFKWRIPFLWQKKRKNISLAVRHSGHPVPLPTDQKIPDSNPARV
jgi:hypothetical protein